MSVKAIESKLAMARQYYLDCGARARELKKQGRRFVGYLCGYVPVEIISAAGLIPFRIRGKVDVPITLADSQMETIVCSLVRSCYDMSLKGRYDFLEGLIVPHACDCICRTYDIWKYTLGMKYNHLINIPHETSDAAIEFFSHILNTFRRNLSRFAKKEIRDEDVNRSIVVYNRVRSKVRDLYDLRKTVPPKISGSEAEAVLIAGTGISVEEFDDLLSGVIAEVRARDEIPQERLPRIMVVSSQMDSTNMFDLIEQIGAAVVGDDLCPGSREFFSEVDASEDPIHALAERYLLRIHCARTYRKKRGSYQEYLDERFGHIGRFIKEYDVDGVILFFYKYCDPYGFEVPQMKSYIEAMGTSVLHLEDEYCISSVGRLRTRIEAFLEMLTEKKRCK
jgi:benzoyl-CoA reductase subunit C